jgi:hypothetical protein
MKLHKTLLGAVCGGVLAAGAAESVTGVVDFSQPEARARISATAVTLSPATSAVLRVTTHANAKWPGVTIRPEHEIWDFSRSMKLLVHLRNPGDEPLEMHVRVDDAKREQVAHAKCNIAPHSTDVVEVRLNPLPFRLSHPLKLIGLRGGPGVREEIDTAHIKRLIVFPAKSPKSQTYELLRIETLGAGSIQTLDADKFLPFVDEFGQFKHGEWPGKLHGANEFAARLKAEDADLAAHPTPADRDSYGGWAAGPKLEATGFFRTTKHDGRWWLVDPDGRLFWSQGMDCVRSGAETPLTGRENYFSWLPPHTGDFGSFYAKRGRASVGYYKDVARYEAFNFLGANLLRKYGAQWSELDVDRAHRRLASWGYNTVGNWSEWAVVSKRRTPYVGTVSARSPPIAGSHGYWGQFPDPFHPDFAPALRKALEKDKSVGEKWCLGVFIHNELAWGSETSLAEATLQSPADQPAKKEFLADLAKKYGDIARLNAAWGTKHISWDALRAAQAAPDAKRAKEDLAAFYTRIAEKYFEVCRAESKRAAPHQLYLGCRFAWKNERAVRAAAKFCDVISFNRYDYSVANDKLPEGVDLPMIIGEYHFGALDRGLFHTGLKATKNQDDRAAKYRAYLEGALRHPNFVGAHWFEYRDEPLSGRFDGENYQIGFVDVCDNPYPETIAAAREIGAKLYTLRAGK